MLIVEAFIKFGSVGIMLALATLIWRDARQVPALRYALLLIFTMCLTALTTGSEALRVSGALYLPMRLMDMFTPLFIWLLGLSLFDDEFELGLKECLIGLMFALVSLYTRLYFFSGFDHLPFASVVVVVNAMFALCLMCHLIYRALVGHKEDLIEKRRRARILFAVAVALVLIVSILAEQTMFALEFDSQWTIWITYIFTFPLCIWAVLWLTSLHPEAVSFQDKPVAVRPIEHFLDPRDAPAQAKLIDIMENERGFAEHGLTIGSLAEKVGVPAHQLRALINRSMGHQNFSAFLNHYRVKDVQQALADKDNSRIPVLTLAMNAGFASLAPFNRAFKSVVGVTPTEYRSQLLDKEINKSD